MQNSIHTFESESKMKIGNSTYIVVSHFDEHRENLPDKICQLLKSEVEAHVAQLRAST